MRRVGFRCSCFRYCNRHSHESKSTWSYEMDLTCRIWTCTLEDCVRPGRCMMAEVKYSAMEKTCRGLAETSGIAIVLQALPPFPFGSRQDLVMYHNHHACLSAI